MRTHLATASIAFALLLPLVPGCQEAAPGDQLCVVADVEGACGIPAGDCLGRLVDDEDFHVEHAFTAWQVSAQPDGEGGFRCILGARDLGSGSVIDDDVTEDNHAVSFDVGAARPEGTAVPDAVEEADVAQDA